MSLKHTKIQYRITVRSLFKGIVPFILVNRPFSLIARVWLSRREGTLLRCWFHVRREGPHAPATPSHCGLRPRAGLIALRACCLFETDLSFRSFLWVRPHHSASERSERSGTSETTDPIPHRVTLFLAQNAVPDEPIDQLGQGGSRSCSCGSQGRSRSG